MKETPISTCEKQFIQQSVKDGLRIDGRGLTEQRKYNITFGTEWGCCQVVLGNTRVMAQVSCSVQVPTASRSNEGMLFINVEMSTMAAEHFEAGRLGQFGVEVNRLVERCIKDSKCVDLESLCILVEEKAWEVRVDIHILNHDGNLIDASTLAALGALCHFRRPDVTLDGREVIIHPYDVRDPVPLTILHYPLSLTFALFNQGKICVLDPTNVEERSADGKLIMGLNAYKELCTLQIGGDGVFINKNAVMSCASIAASKAVELVNSLKTILAQDLSERAKGNYTGLVMCVAKENERITTQSQAEVHLRFATAAPDVDMELKTLPEETIKSQLSNDQGVVTLVSTENQDEMVSSESEDDVEVVRHIPAASTVSRIPEVDLGDESEEEPVMLVTQ